MEYEEKCTSWFAQKKLHQIVDQALVESETNARKIEKQERKGFRSMIASSQFSNLQLSNLATWPLGNLTTWQFGNLAV